MLRMLQALVALTGYELLALGVDDATEATALLFMILVKAEQHHYMLLQWKVI